MVFEEQALKERRCAAFGVRSIKDLKDNPCAASGGGKGFWLRKGGRDMAPGHAQQVESCQEVFSVCPKTSGNPWKGLRGDDQLAF